MKKSILVVIILGIIIIVLASVLLFVKNNKEINYEGIEILSPKLNQTVSSPLKITGIIHGNGWTGFEGQVGTVRLIGSEGVQLGQTAILTAVTDWMALPVDFETYLQFSSDKDQDGKLVFRNENPSGLPDKDKEFIMPVKIKKGSGEIMTVKAYFNNSEMDPEVSCNKVFPVVRQIPKTEAVAAAALQELLKGPVGLEKNAGFFTSINEGVKIQSLAIKDGTALVDFDNQLQNMVGGSCRVTAIRAQITQTLEQFSTVKGVVISINGRTEDILQP